MQTASSDLGCLEEIGGLSDGDLSDFSALDHRGFAAANLDGQLRGVVGVEEEEDEEEDGGDNRLIPLDPRRLSSRDLQGGSQQRQLQPHRKTARKQDTAVQWEVIVADATREVFEAKLAATVAVEIAPATEWGYGVWKPPTGFSKLGLRRRQLRCPFRGEANACCNAMLRETQDENGRWTLERKRGVPHADHMISNKRVGLPKMMKLAVAAEVKQGVKSSKVVDNVRDLVGAISKKEVKQIARERGRIRQKEQDAIVPRDQRNEFGGMVLLSQRRAPST